MSAVILELDEIIRRYAWEILKKNTNFIRRAFLNEENYTCEVDWSAISFEHKLAKFTNKDFNNTVIETNYGNVVTGSRWVPLWSCDFDNKADSKQNHSFRGSRDTTTWVDVDLEQCYTISKEVSVQVNLPPNFSKVRAGRDNTLSLNKLKGQVFKEVLTWEVNSQVEVLPAWKARAQLLAKEECCSMEFEIRTTLFAKGLVTVKFLRKTDKRMMYIVEIENFLNAFKVIEEGGVIRPEEKPCVEMLIQRTIDKDGIEHTVTCPQLITKGSCVCLSWSDQKVDIKTSHLSIDESSYDGDGNITFSSSSSVVNNISEKKILVKSY